jgi:asparagine synthase (glutamine-hydrolysing)
MGAIFGIVGQGSLAEVETMGRRLGHRGSCRAVWCPGPGAYFGQIGPEPFSVESGFPLAEDPQLDGAPESPLSRAERFQRNGSGVFAGLRGCFAFAFYDAAVKRLLLAVDQLGYKTIYYTCLPDRFAFATEYKALLALLDLAAEPDRDAVQRYLATKQQWLGRTLLSGVRSLAPGQLLRLDASGVQVGAYWQPIISEVTRSRKGHAQVVRNALLETVRRHVHSRSEVGITLGGGLDAASVLGAIRRVAPGMRVASFTVGVGEEDSEILGGRETARIFGTEHHECFFKLESIPSQLPRLIWLMEDCGGREEALLQLTVLTEAGRHSRLVMGGHGADVLFGGMPRSRLVSFAENLPVFRAPLRELFFLSQSGTLPRSLLGRALQLCFYGTSYPGVPSVTGAGPSEQVIWEDGLNEFIRKTIQYIPSLRYLEPAHEISHTTFRSPFLDPDFIAASLTVPARLKVRWGRGKAILRDAVAELVPPTISRRPKAIQRLSHGEALSSLLGAMAGELLPGGALESHGLLTKRELDLVRARCLGRHTRNRGGKREQVYGLWTAISLELWARQFLDRRGAAEVLAC